MALSPLFNSELYQWNLLSSPMFVTGLLLVILSTLAVVRERFSSTSVAFSLMTIPAMLWLFSFSAMYLCKDEQTALSWAKIGYCGVPFIPFTIYYFTFKVLRFPDSKRWILWVFLALSTLCAYTLIQGNIIFGRMMHYSWGFYPKYEWPSVWTAAYLALFFGIMILSLYHYWAEFKKPQTEIHQKRIQCLFLAFSIAYVASIDFLPKFGVNVYPLGFLGVLCFMLMSFYVLKRYRLVDLRPSLAAEKIMGLMGDILLVLDAEDVVRIANDAACHYLEMPKSQLVGTPLSHLKLPLMGWDSKTKEDKNYENSDEKNRSFSVSESFVKDPLGDVAAKVIILRDITSFKKTQADLVEAQSRCAELYNEVPEPILIVDEFGRFFSVNQAAEKLFNRTEKSLVGKIFVMSDLLPSSSMGKVVAAIRSVIEGVHQEPFRLELQKMGTMLHLKAYASPVRQNGRVIAVQFLLKDMTQEERMEVEVKKAREEMIYKFQTLLQELAPQQDLEKILNKIKSSLNP